MGVTVVNAIARWSDMDRLGLVRSLIGMCSVEQTRSRMWPRLWVGFICFVKLKPCSISLKSAEVDVVQSKRRLKSPRRSMDGEVDDNSASNVEKSDRKQGLDLGR